MPAPILSDDEMRAGFEANLAKQKKLTKDDRDDAREDFERTMANHENHRFDVQKHYDQGKGRP